MHRKPFGVLYPLKYALRALVRQWQLVLGFAGILIAGEIMGSIFINAADWLFGGDRFNVIFSLYHKLIVAYQRMELFEVDFELWGYPLTQSWPIALIVGLMMVVFAIWVEVGLIETALKWHDTGHVSIKNLISRSYMTVIRLIPFVLMVLGIFVLLAVFLNYLPHIYFGKKKDDLFDSIKALLELYILFRVSFVAYYMIDKKVTLMYAIKHAYHPHNWQGGQLFEAYFATYLFDIGAAFIPYIGIGVGSWVICFAEIYIYRKLIPYQKKIDTNSEIISG